MGLRDLTSDLTSLKFNDFKSDSNPKPKPAIVKKIGKGGRNSTFDVQGILLSKRLDDVIRMAKLVVARPGLEFAAKQAIGALIQANQSKESFATDSSMFKLVLQPALDILASAVTNIGQTAVNGLGVHLNKGLKEIKGEDFRSYEVRALDKSIRKGDLDVHKFSGKSGRIRKAEKLKLAKVEDKLGSYIDYRAGTAKGTSVGMEGVIKDEPTEFDDQMIPFVIQTIGYDGEGSHNYMRFHAFLDNFDDSYNASWNPTTIPGRAESVYQYGGFQRSSNFSFKCAALHRAELLPMYEKLQFLAGATAPTYQDLKFATKDDERRNMFNDSVTGVHMRGTIVRLTIGDYLHKQTALINSVQFSWQQDYPWEIQAGKDKEKTEDGKLAVRILPHVLDVSVSATLIHEFAPQTGDQRFIGSNIT